MAVSVEAEDVESGSNPIRYRQVIAILAFIAALVALYLHLVKIGTFGIPACGRGNECAAAWFSPWGSPMGVDTALIGTIGYSLLTVVALLGTRADLEDSPAITNAMLGMIVAGIAFTWWLKHGEWVVMKIFCIWCFESFVTIHACLVLAWLDRRRVRTAAASAA